MPFDRKRYPKDWEQIRARILERAEHKCERCGVANHAIGYREKNGRFVQLAESISDVGFDTILCDEKIIRIVLTIAHIHDPDPTNCADGNLQALCQRCHNRLDAPMRAKNAATTRRNKNRAIARRNGQKEMALS
jgi:hypothetical protein